MANDWIPAAVPSKLRTRLYNHLFQNEVLIFSEPKSYEAKTVKTYLDRHYEAYFIKRNGKSALNITAVSKKTRIDSIPFLASLVRFDLETRKVTQWFRDTFPVETRKAVEDVFIRDNAGILFSYPTARNAWASLQRVTIVEVPSRRDVRHKEKKLETEAATIAWVKQNWPIVAGSENQIIPSMSGITSILAATDRRFTLQCTVFIDQETDAIVELDKSGRPVALASPGLEGMRREDRRQEYFEMKQSGYDSVKELDLVNVRTWAQTANTIGQS